MKKLLKIVFVLILFVLLWFACTVVSYRTHEKRVYSQINKEYSILTEECTPVILYLKSYKEKNGIYPDKIEPEILPHSKTFDKFEYGVTENKKGYWLEIYPRKRPIEYYYNDEYDSGFNYYIGTGYIDGFLDNTRYYEIDKTFHAITYDYLSMYKI